MCPDMKISVNLNKRLFSLSFEVFPPKREGNLNQLFQTIYELIEMKPHFISVTYGAGGSTRDKTIEIAARVNNDIGITSLAHLTCVQTTRTDMARTLAELKEKGIENILALRGDPPLGEEKFSVTQGGFAHASDLVAFIHQYDTFCIGVAGYPEKHLEAPDMDTDLFYLKQKVNAGADFIITQLFSTTMISTASGNGQIKWGFACPSFPAFFLSLTISRSLVQ